jgi:hypothetical protein
MKAKKKARQEAEREQNEAKKQQDWENNLLTVTLKKDDSYMGNYRWKCPNHDGTFSWSRQINARWGHPDDFAFCAVCCVYHKIQFE